MRHAGLGLAIAALSSTAALAESVWSRGAIYAAPSPSAVAEPPVAREAVALPIAPHRGTRRLVLRSRAALRVANSAVETTPAPTPITAPEATATSPAPAEALKDGPHERPAPTMDALITKHATENGVPPALATAVVRIESRFNPKARGGSAIGLMQIKVDTARSMGFSGGAASLFQPETNLHFGMKVLADAYKASHGDVCMTLARYQSGHLVTRMSAANRTYCARARSFMAKL